MSVVSRPAGLYQHSDPPCTATAASRVSERQGVIRKDDQRTEWLDNREEESV